MLKRLYLVLTFFLLFNGIASAFNVAGMQNQRPYWSPYVASLATDFSHQRYAVKRTQTSVTSLVSLTRASQKTDLLPNSISGFIYRTYANNIPAINQFGFLPEETRINQLSNSVTPATQTTGSLNTGVYTLWVNGSGSAQMSAGTGTGCGTGTATNGAPVNFTITVAGTCTVTVTGSLNAFQLEAGADGTSLIVCVTAPCTRQADNATFINSAFSLFLNSSGTVYITYPTGIGVSGASSVAFLAESNGTKTIIGYNALSPGIVRTIWNASATQLAVANTTTRTAALKAAMAWSAAGRSIVSNGGTVATDTNIVDTPAAIQIGAASASAAFANGYIGNILLFNSRQSNSTIQSITK